MKILNFGSLNIDYVYQVERFALPGETISSSKMERFCGGKGLNQSVALARAGVSVSHAGCIGSDGEFLIKELETSGVKTEKICVRSSASGHAIIGRLFPPRKWSGSAEVKDSINLLHSQGLACR